MAPTLSCCSFIRSISQLRPSARRRSALAISRRIVAPCAQLVGMPEGFGQNNIETNNNEILLAELRFSDPSKLPALVQNNLDQLDDEFYSFIESKISASADMEERDTLRTLLDAITSVMKQLLEAADAAEVQAAVKDPSNATVDVTTDGNVAQASYDELIDQMLKEASASDTTVKRVVDKAYTRIDMTLLERLNARIAANDNNADNLALLRDAINATMSDRIQTALGNVQTVLSAGDPTAMRKAVDSIARMGSLDDAFILLLQANIDQAKQAGATQAVEVMQMVFNHAQGVRDVQLDPEIRLIRALLRTDDADTRTEMLMEAFKPRGSVTLMDGSASSGVDVDGKQFVVSLRKLIEEFGNVDEKFVLKLSSIGEESEDVARKLFDMEGKDVEDLQDEAFHKRTVSIWDLEQYEVQQQMQGSEAEWEGRMGPIPEGFNEEGKMQIGGQ